jgi:hypothetical protein
MCISQGLLARKLRPYFSREAISARLLLLGNIQGRFSEIIVGTHVRAKFNQSSYSSGISHQSGTMQGRISNIAPRVDVCSGGNENGNVKNIACFCRKVEQCVSHRTALVRIIANFDT